MTTNKAGAHTPGRPYRKTDAVVEAVATLLGCASADAGLVVALNDMHQSGTLRNGGATIGDLYASVVAHHVAQVERLSL